MLFADDSNAFIIHKNLHQLKQNAERLFIKLEEWFSSNKLTINIDKTNYNIFHSPRKKICKILIL